MTTCARRGRKGLLPALLAVALVACGGDDGPAGNAGSGGFEPPPVPAEAATAVKRACDTSSPTIERIKDDGVLFWAIAVSPPFGFESEPGVWSGVEAQNAEELATVLGVDYDITEYSYQALPHAIVTGQADIVGAELFVTAVRRKLIDFSRPYYQSGQLFYVLDRSPFETIDDLNRAGVRFVYGTGTAQQQLANKYIPRAEVQHEELGQRLLFHDLLAAGKADATLSQAAALKVIRDRFTRPPLAAIGRHGRVTGKRASSREVIDPFDVAFGLPKGDAGWRRCIDAWVRDLVDSGRMARRIDYWLAQPVT